MLSLALTLLAAPAAIDACPGIDPGLRRARGTNCYGITLRECGADRARAYLGLRATPAVRLRVRRAVGHDQIRWIRPGEPVIQDLRRNRLNMQLDKRGRIAIADCY
ncbi:hypothetical protein HJG53_05200 [Sphingomonas sp. ID1715]|uniref:I78 family peptidase inhibitor n=1 Tax=Sphingomonas sp. ID1715 TaxID=1656898 RepID=UPI001487F0AE|nr:I78 family peptidase inhibitor [Sphingomonas sp. ID1715]NNM76298.1 hypothetical protein [Sphingomonas sp. ID1715]